MTGTTSDKGSYRPVIYWALRAYYGVTRPFRPLGWKAILIYDQRQAARHNGGYVTNEKGDGHASLGT